MDMRFKVRDLRLLEHPDRFVRASSGSWRATTPILARIGTTNRGGFVAQAFEPAGSGDFPVARSWSTGLESPVNPQAGKPALQAGSWRGVLLSRLRMAARNQPGMGRASAVSVSLCPVLGQLFGRLRDAFRQERLVDAGADAVDPGLQAVEVFVQPDVDDVVHLRVSEVGT